jgi:toxin CcdB
MARYDAFPNPAGPGYLLDLQSDLLDRMATRVVAPLLPETAAPPPATRLNPVLDVAGERHVLLTQSLAAVPVAILARPAANLAHAADAVTGALDMLFHGF